MSYSNYIKAIKLAKECDDYCIGDEVSSFVINKAEELVGIKYSAQLTEYLKTCGYLEFFGVELYGIVKTDFSSSVVEGCIIEWALKERKDSNLNMKWLPLRFEDDGGMAFLDFNNLNKDGEPKVILAINSENGYEMTDILADDFGDYLLELVECQLEEQ